MIDPTFTSATKLAAQTRKGERRPSDVIEAHLMAIEETSDRTNAFVTVFEESARKRARALDDVDPNRRGPLHGVPVAIKDLKAYKEGTRHTFGAVPFADNVTDETATFVERLEAAGAVVVGKTNTPEFGYKAITDNRLVGPTSTPFDIDRNAGGSSGGSAAAVAEGLCAIGQGTDGGGSIRIPAAWCGVVGFMGSFGRVAERERPNGFMLHTPFQFSGPITRTVADAALMLDVVAGPHPRDPFSLPEAGTDYLAATDDPIDEMTVAYTADWEVFPVADAVRETVGDAVSGFEDAGATVDAVDLGIDDDHETLTDAWHHHIAVLTADMARNFEREGIDLLGEHRDTLPSAFVAMMERGFDTSAVAYRQADRIRSRVFDAMQNTFERYDLVVGPTVSVPSVPNANDGDGGTVGPSEIEGESVDPLVGWSPAYLMNFTGHPTISLPAGLADDLPVGIQVTGRRFADRDVLAAGAAFERERPWHDAYPRRPA